MEPNEITPAQRKALAAIGSVGGSKTVKRHGRRHMSAIGKKGAEKQCGRKPLKVVQPQANSWNPRFGAVQRVRTAQTDFRLPGDLRPQIKNIAMAKEEKKVPTPEQKAAELQARQDGFNKELSPLLGKYELGLAAVPFISADGRLAAQPILVDARKAAEDKKAAEKKKLSEG
jgi:hypothetical protein